MDRIKIVKRIVSDLIVLGIGGLVLLLYRFHVKPYKRGFFCDDQTLQHPYKESTVPSYILYIVGFVGGAIIITAVESLRISQGLSRPVEGNEGEILYSRWALIIRDFYLAYAPFCFGAVLQNLITDIGKYEVGRLRPHFFSVCNIDFSKVNCSAGYIEDFTCENEVDDRVREVRLSFPSGHSSFSTYIAVYLIIYLQLKLNLLFNSLLRPFFQTVLASLAWYTCLSRISDYKHHPTDVLGGAVIGIVSAITVAFGVSDMVSQENKKKFTRKTQDNDSFTTPL